MESFLDYDFIETLLNRPQPDEKEVSDVLAKAQTLGGLSIEEAAVLLRAEKSDLEEAILAAAGEAKEKIYGRRLVLFAPLYVGNYCENSCTYCGFRRENKNLQRVKLNMNQIEEETRALIEEGHKRLLLLTGESSQAHPLSFLMKAIETIYKTQVNGATIRRINIEVAPLSTEEFRELSTARIGTYACFQETYDPRLYPRYHPRGPKSHYLNRLFVMDRAMEGGIDDVGLGVLFGLGDYRFETLALLEHARHLEERFNCGPHTISVPRVGAASHAPDSLSLPSPVGDAAFKRIVAVLRLALPYTGIILSTRESQALRRKLLKYGVSQISAGSKTTPGGYAKGAGGREKAQFSLRDHRSLDEVISDLIDDEFIPSFCTGCYRRGRTGADFMDLAKPGEIKHYCAPNAIFSFAEYLEDYAESETKAKGYAFIREFQSRKENQTLKKRMGDALDRIQRGERDLYF